MKKTIPLAFVFLGSLSIITIPLVASAQQLQPIRTLIGSLGFVVNALIPLIMAGAVVAFFYGLAHHLWNRGDLASGASDKGHRNYMIGGLIALFIMASLWGIIKVVQNAFDIQAGGNIQPPTVPILN